MTLSIFLLLFGLLIVGLVIKELIATNGKIKCDAMLVRILVMLTFALICFGIGINLVLGFVARIQ